jgi:two-component system response regulator
MIEGTLNEWASASAPNGSELRIETILLAEDNQDDALIIRHAFAKACIVQNLQHVTDGDEAVKYILGEGPYADRNKFPFPDLLVLDLNMARMGGLDVLAWLEGRPESKTLPAIVLTESFYEPNVIRAYQLGAKTYISKPVRIDDLSPALKKAASYCVHGTQLPTSAPFVPPPLQKRSHPEIVSEAVTLG